MERAENDYLLEHETEHGDDNDSTDFKLAIEAFERTSTLKREPPSATEISKVATNFEGTALEVSFTSLDPIPVRSEEQAVKNTESEAVNKIASAKSLKEALPALSRDEAKALFNHVTAEMWKSPRVPEFSKADAEAAFKNIKVNRGLSELSLEQCYALRVQLKEQFNLRSQGEPVLVPVRMGFPTASISPNPWSRISDSESTALKDDMLAMAEELKQREPHSTERVGTGIVSRDYAGRVIAVKERDYKLYFDHGSGERPAAVMIEQAGKMRIMVPCGVNEWAVLHGNGAKDYVSGTDLKLTKDFYGVKKGKEWTYYPTSTSRR